MSEQKTDNLKALDALISAANTASLKKTGVALPVQKASKMDLSVKYISTGNDVLDKALGGGWPRGHISLLYGSEGIGKTYTTLQTAAELSKQKKITIYWATEGRPSEDVLRMAGVDTEYLYIIEPQDYSEKAVDLIERFLFDEEKKKPRNIVECLIVDSINNVVGKKEVDKLLKEGAEGNNMAVQASILTNLIRRLQGRGMMEDMVVLFIAQYRANMETMSKVKYTLSGGFAVKFGPKVIVRLHRAGEQKNADRVLAHTVSVNVEKNNVTGYKAVAEYTVLRPDEHGEGSGLDDAGRLVQVGIDYGYIRVDKDLGRAAWRIILPENGDIVVNGKGQLEKELRAYNGAQVELRAVLKGGRPKELPAFSAVIRDKEAVSVAAAEASETPEGERPSAEGAE